MLIVWQVLDPLQWVRELTQGLAADGEYAADPWVSYGQCKSEVYGVVPFIVPLVSLFAITILMTLAISWKMREVQSELSEAKWIFIAIFSHLQVWAIGIPVYFILAGVSRDASYLISMGLIFVFSNMFVVVVIWPKMIADIRVMIHGAAPQNKRASRVSIKQPSTFISGMNNPSSTSQQSSAASYNDDKLKILSLESEIQDLKEQLGEGQVEAAPDGEPIIIDAECEPQRMEEPVDTKLDDKKGDQKKEKEHVSLKT